MEKNSTNSLHGQVTIGILILQVSDCSHLHVMSIVFVDHIVFILEFLFK